MGIMIEPASKAEAGIFPGRLYSYPGFCSSTAPLLASITL